MSDSVGLAMIVKDAESTLDICLKSVQGLFDQTVIVDTGSTDNTKDIAIKYGAELYDHPWVYDFSVPRNASFDALRTKWAFWLDADDMLLGREYFDEMVSKCAANNLDGVILEYIYSFDDEGQKILEEIEPRILDRTISTEEAYVRLKQRCNTTQFRERLILRDPSWRWLYPVHEALPVLGKRLGRFDKIKIIHRRHKTARPAKNRRNLDILERVPESMRDERICFYLGLEYAAHNMADNAIKFFERYLPISSVPDEKYLALHYLADLYRHKNDLDTSINYDLRALEMRPTWRDAYAGLLSSYYRKNDLEKALYYGAKAKISEAPDTPFAYNPVNQEFGWVGEYVNTLLALNMHEEALQECQRVIKRMPDNTDFLNLADDISTVINAKAGTQSLSDTLEFLLRSDNTDTAAILISRLPRILHSNDKLKPQIQLVNSLCSYAARGDILPDRLKVRSEDTHRGQLEGIGLFDIRIKHLIDRLAVHPRVKTICIVGGPIEIPAAFTSMGYNVTRIDNVFSLNGKYDCVIVWNALERMRQPERFMSAISDMVNLGGVLFVMTPDGPTKRGLAPPHVTHTKMRAFDVDSLRRLIKTTRMPSYLPTFVGEAAEMVFEIPMPIQAVTTRSIAIMCPLSPEPWGPWSLDRGIGGSEEAVIRLSRAFTQYGHDVTVFGSGWEGNDLVDGYGEVKYKALKEYKASDVLIGWRYPEIFFGQIIPFEAGWKALWLHDSTPRERVEMAIPFVDKVWCISQYHASKYAGLPKIYEGRNGIDAEDFPKDIERNPHKVVYISTPFRGLDTLLEYWPKIKERIPDAELHAYYGWESADKMGVTSTEEGRKFKEAIVSQVERLGVHWHGRIGQRSLYREVSSAGVWAYPTRWHEEHCISAYIAQAGGAWPVVFPLGALPQSVAWGWKTTPDQFVNSVTEAMMTEDGREEMMEWGRGLHTSWREVVTLWERLWSGWEA